MEILTLYYVVMVTVPMLYHVGAARSSSKYREEVYKPYPRNYRKTVQCYQCAYSPAKTVYKTIKYPVEVKAYYGRYSKTRVAYRTKMVPVRKSGGWDKCMGPFDHLQAKTYGLDVWECDHNCYVRVDMNGNVFRGCYKGEFGVNPSRVGCSRQAGQIYCFCNGDKCNHGTAPTYGRPERH